MLLVDYPNQYAAFLISSCAKGKVDGRVWRKRVGRLLRIHYIYLRMYIEVRMYVRMYIRSYVHVSIHIWLTCLYA